MIVDNQPAAVELAKDDRKIAPDRFTFVVELPLGEHQGCGIAQRGWSQVRGAVSHSKSARNLRFPVALLTNLGRPADPGAAGMNLADVRR